MHTVNQNPEMAFSRVLQNFNKEKMAELSGALTSNNPNSKISALSAIIFRESAHTLREVKKQMELVESALHPCVEAMLVAQFGDPAGNIGWVSLSKFIVDEMVKPDATGRPAMMT
eukprot:Skav224500  [mRNA]  locus=scaffold1478:170277:170621:- [translate_table: standard]